MVLAFPGMVAGVRRGAFLTWLLLGLSVSGATVIALNSGNVGTLVRIRDTIVPLVACIAALGAVSMSARIFPARSSGAPTDGGMTTNVTSG